MFSSVDVHQNKPKNDAERDLNNPVKTRVEIETITAPYNSRLPTSTPTKKRKNPSAVHSKGYLSTIKHVERRYRGDSNKENDSECTCLEDLKAAKSDSANELPAGNDNNPTNSKENVIDNDSQKECFENKTKDSQPLEPTNINRNSNNNNGYETTEVRNTNRRNKDRRPYIYRDYRSKSRENKRDKCPHCKLLKGEVGDSIPKTRFHCRCQCVTKEHFSESSDDSSRESDIQDRRDNDNEVNDSEESGEGGEEDDYEDDNDIDNDDDEETHSHHHHYSDRRKDKGKKQIVRTYFK